VPVPANCRSHVDELEALAVAFQDGASQRGQFGRGEPGIGGDELLSVAGRQLEQVVILHEIGDLELGQPVLARAEELAGAAGCARSSSAMAKPSSVEVKALRRSLASSVLASPKRRQ